MTISLGHTIRELRRDNGLSVRGLARELAVSAGYVSRVEGRGEIPSASMVLRMAELLGAESGELLEFSKLEQLRAAGERIDTRNIEAIALYRKSRQ